MRTHLGVPEKLETFILQERTLTPRVPSPLLSDSPDPTHQVLWVPTISVVSGFKLFVSVKPYFYFSQSLVSLSHHHVTGRGETGP